MERTEVEEQLVGALERIRVGRFEPRQILNFSQPAREQEKEGLGEVDAMDFRGLVAGTGSMVLLIPKPETDPGSDTAGPGRPAGSTNCS